MNECPYISSCHHIVGMSCRSIDMLYRSSYMFGSYREYVPRIIDMLCWSRDLLVLLVPGRSRVGLAPSLRPSSSYRSPERPPNQSHTLPFQKVMSPLPLFLQQ